MENSSKNFVSDKKFCKQALRVPFATLCFLAFLCSAELACSASEPPAKDIFSTPDAASAPVFAGRNKPSLFLDPLLGSGEPPSREAVRAIPSITGAQLKQLDDIINQSRDLSQPLQDELASLHRIQDHRRQQKQQQGSITANGGPGLKPNAERVGRDDGTMSSMQSMTMMSGESSGQGMNESSDDEPDESIKDHIDILNGQLREMRGRLWPTIRAILSPEQLDELSQMRKGQLVIAKNAPTDLPEPLPAHNTNAKPAAPGHPPNPNQRPFPHPPSSQPHLVQPLIYTTKQMLYRNLWRL